MITCDVCHENTITDLKKPKTEKLVKIENEADNQKISTKRKKKKRDKTAGLIINTPKRDQLTPTMMIAAGNKKKVSNFTPIPAKKLNIAKLKGMIDTSMTPAKRPSLHSFLTELG